VVLLRGINVGGHRSFRPTVLAEQLEHLDVVNIGAAGTFVVRAPVSRTRLREEISRRLPFDAEIVVLEGRELARLLARAPFVGDPAPGITRFVSVLARRPRAAPALPMRFPPRGRWLMQVLTIEERFVFGLYRRDMKVIRYLGLLDRLFGAPATTRNWNTLRAVATAACGDDTG
jgi:uncharacterized protein (DUF1697 family)